MSVRARRWQWLLIKRSGLELFGSTITQDKYHIVKTGANNKTNPYGDWEIIGTFASREEAAAMKKLLD